MRESVQRSDETTRDGGAGPAETFGRIAATVGEVIRGQEQLIRHVLAAMVGGGHVLLEDFPGTGKTTLAKAIARAIDASFKRIQFTPDLLPSDILGVSIYNQRDRTFDFHEGPIFAHLVLADEINRASPRTQSALLEAMAEQQVSVEGSRRHLSDPFFVLATQNPVEFRGTYPLPEAQMDRFAVQLTLGYVPVEDEIAILSAQETGHPLDRIMPCATITGVRAMQQAAGAVRLADELKRYIVELVAATRSAAGVQLGASPRASLALMKLAQALAMADGLAFVTPDHIQEVAVQTIAHRLVVDPQATFSGITARGVVTQLLERTPVPA